MFHMHCLSKSKWDMQSTSSGDMFVGKQRFTLGPMGSEFLFCFCIIKPTHCIWTGF